MREFIFDLFTRCGKQEFKTGSIKIVAKNYDEASKKLSYNSNVPFHHFATVTSKLLTNL